MEYLLLLFNSYGNKQIMTTLLANIEVTAGLLLFPVELILPVLGLLLIRTESPIRGLIYRSFLGSIAALIYAAVGAPDVALTEVLVGTLLSAILYIITIRACYTILIVVPEDYIISDQISQQVSEIFNELHFQVKYLRQDFDEHAGNYNELLSATTLSGSPHAVLDNRGICIESPMLLRDLKSTNYYQTNTMNVQLFTGCETTNESEVKK